MPIGEDLPLLLQLMPSLDALLRERNVTRAANLLGISQPGLSFRLGQLRELLGDPLLVPAANGRGMVPTPRAEALRGGVAAVLAQTAAMRAGDAFDPATSERVFRILCTDQAVYVLAPLLLSALDPVEHTRLRLDFRSMPETRITALIETDEVDLVLGVSPTIIGEANLRTSAIMPERSVLVFNRHRADDLSTVDLDRFCALPFVVLTDERSTFRGITDTMLEALGRSRRAVVAVPTFMLALTIVAQSDLVAVVPRRIVEPFSAQLGQAELPFAFPAYSYVAAWHPRLANDPGHRWLRRKLQERQPGATSGGDPMHSA